MAEKMLNPFIQSIKNTICEEMFGIVGCIMPAKERKETEVEPSVYAYT